MDNSPLDNLPGELRNQVYKNALDSSNKVAIQLVYKDNSDVIDVVKSLESLEFPLALTETCKQIRQESAASIKPFENFVLKIPERPVLNSFGQAEDGPIDLLWWRAQLSKSRLAQPRQITLEYGTVTVSSEQSTHVAAPNTSISMVRSFERLKAFAQHSPRYVAPQGCEMFVSFCLQVEPDEPLQLRFPIRVWGESAVPKDQVLQLPAFKLIQDRRTSFKSFLADDWKELSLAEIEMARRRLYIQMSAAEQQVKTCFRDLYY